MAQAKGISDARVSVCIPNYNYGRFVGRCIESVLSQTYSSFEIVISDNCSTDESDQIIRGYKDSRIHYVRQPQHVTMTENFMVCVSLSQAPYLLLLSSDDYLKPRLLEKCVAQLEANPNVAFCHTACEFFDDKGSIVGTTGDFTASYVRSGRSLIEDFLYGKRVLTTSALYRRQCFEEMGGWSDDYLICMDVDLCFRMLLRWDVAYVGEVLAGFRSHSVSDSWRLAYIAEELKFLRDMYDRLPESHQHLKKYRDAAVSNWISRTLSVLETFSPSTERDEVIHQLSTDASFKQISQAAILDSKKFSVVRAILKKFPRFARYPIGAITDYVKRSRIHRLARSHADKICSR